MAPSSLTSDATLHALTERLAVHRALSPLMSTDLSSLSPRAMAAAASAYRQPAPPPQLPSLQLVGRHQDTNAHEKDKAKVDGGNVNGSNRCKRGHTWGSRGEHRSIRTGEIGDDDLDGFVEDMGIVLRREFDVWVEQCWTEAFHHLFSHTLPTLLIQLILTGASPTFLRRQIVHGGPALDNLFQTQMLDLLYHELELRLSGARPHGEPRGESSAMGMASAVAATAGGLLGATGFGGAQPGPSMAIPRDGVCFHDIATSHGIPPSEDDHANCLCQLTACLQCFEESATKRKGPVSLLPYDLAKTAVSTGWTGGIESESQARERKGGTRSPPDNQSRIIPSGRGFVKNPKANKPNPLRPVQMFPHPQMTDVLAVEEHLRWRLKEMGASDPAVEARYGPSTNSPAALEGVDLPDDLDDDESVHSENGPGKLNGTKTKLVKMTKGRGKVRRVVNGAPKKAKGKICYLPKQWAEEEPSVRNMAIVLTYRHFVKLLHQTAVASSPFSYPAYPKDVEEFNRVHPIALYRRLAEPSISRRKIPKETKAWQECMDKWAEELGAREKTQGNIRMNESRQAEAVEYYTRAISLDPKKTVYFSNRAVALNNLGHHQKAEQDCRHILSRDSKNGKAFYQRALARRGMQRWREAEGDLKEVLKFQPGNESAQRLMAVVKAEVARLPKLSVKDVIDF